MLCNVFAFTEVFLPLLLAIGACASEEGTIDSVSFALAKFYLATCPKDIGVTGDWDDSSPLPVTASFTA